MLTPDYWVIGDVQGCIHSLQHLLAQPELQQPNAHYIFLGDLVNRGPGSLEVLTLVHDLGNRAQVVLGNHDIHLLAVAAGVRKQSDSDTLTSILKATNGPALIDWLRHQPLALHQVGHLMVHAGLHPTWNLAQVLALAKRVEQRLQAPDWHQHIQILFGNQPNQWRTDLSDTDTERLVVNILTRLRFFDQHGALSKYSGAPSTTDLTPWFAMPARRIETPVVFGHWSTLGLHMQADVVGLDTGCLWGGQLTAMRLRDRRLVQVENRDGALSPFST